MDLGQANLRKGGSLVGPEGGGCLSELPYGTGSLTTFKLCVHNAPFGYVIYLVDRISIITDGTKSGVTLDFIGDRVEAKIDFALAKSLLPEREYPGEIILV
jgi:hypothetical protein